MDLVHSFPSGKVPVSQLPASSDYKAWEDGNTKFRCGQSRKLQSNQAPIKQSTCLTTSNFRVTWQIRKQLLYLKFYRLLKCFLERVQRRLRPAGLNSPHDLLTCSGLNPNLLKVRKQCLTVNGHCYLHQPLIWALSRQQFFLAFLNTL